MDMNRIDEILDEVDEELAQEEYEEIKQALIDRRRETRRRWAGVKKLVQRVKCFFGSHGYVYGFPDRDVTTFCAHCKNVKLRKEKM